MPPKTRHARHGGARIAYQVVGKGPVDLLVVPGFVSHLGMFWMMPKVTAMFRRLASFSRLILFDKAGTGISDPIDHVPSLEERMDEVHAVLDAAGSERAALLALSEGGLMAILFAASYPERTAALALYGAFPCGTYDESLPPELREHAEWLASEMAAVVDHWGDGRAGDKRSWNLGFFERAAANQAMAQGMVDVGYKLDVRPALGAVRVPTVVIHRSEDPFPIGAARWMAERIPGARFAELAGDMHPPWRGDMDAVVDQVEALVTAAPSAAQADRALMTVLSRRAPRWVAGRDRERGAQPLPRTPDADTRATVCMATFDGPVRAIRCAHAIVAATAAHRSARARRPAHRRMRAAGGRAGRGRRGGGRAPAGRGGRAGNGPPDQGSDEPGRGLGADVRGSRRARAGRRARTPAHRGADAGRRRDARRGPARTPRSPVPSRTRSRPLSA